MDSILEWIGSHCIALSTFIGRHCLAILFGSALLVLGYSVGLLNTRWLSRPMLCWRCGGAMNKKRYESWMERLKP